MTRHVVDAFVNVALEHFEPLPDTLHRIGGSARHPRNGKVAMGAAIPAHDVKVLCDHGSGQLSQHFDHPSHSMRLLPGFAHTA